MSHKKSRTNILAGVVSVLALAGIGIWQFYQFVAFKNASGVVDLQGGTHHLWWAIGLGLTAFIVAFLFFSVFLRYERSDEIHITSVS